MGPSGSCTAASRPDTFETSGRGRDLLPGQRREEQEEPSRTTSGQCSVIRLRIEVYLHHLAPASGSYRSKYVPQVTLPSVCVDAAGDHLAVDHVEVVMGVVESASSIHGQSLSRL